MSRKIDALIGAEVLHQLPVPPRVRWRSTHRERTCTPVFGDLVARGYATRTGEGQVAVGGPVLDLQRRLDTILCGIAVDDFGAVEYRYPTLISTETLRRSGYLTSFPHHVMFATRLRSDLDAYQEFLAAPDAASADSILAYCASPTYSLPPTMCYHTFGQYAGRQLTGQSAVVTARGKSFRFEGRYETDLERLWDFTIREVVFLGSREFAIACREQFTARAAALVDALRLVGHLEVAHDPFFGDQRAAESISSQRLLELKYELRLAVAPDRTIAVGSFNVHDRLFASAFDIRQQDGGTAYTACVGFGLERLAYAVLCQYGADEHDWPELLRTGRGEEEGSG